MSWNKRIEPNPEILAGKPVIKGTRLAVEFVVDLMAQGWTEDEIIRNYPPAQPRRHQGLLAVRERRSPG